MKTLSTNSLQGEVKDFCVSGGYIRDAKGNLVERFDLVADLRIVVDCHALAQAIGRKAILGKRHKSKLQSGAVVVEALNIRREARR